MASKGSQAAKKAGSALPDSEVITIGDSDDDDWEEEMRSASIPARGYIPPPPPPSSAGAAMQRGQPAPLKRVAFAARPSLTSTSFPASRTPLSSNAPLPLPDDQSWHVKHSPKTEADLLLAFHAKKLAEIKEWMQSLSRTTSIAAPVPGGQGQRPRPRLLFLMGNPGIGKSTAVQVLAASLSLEVQEWSPPPASVAAAIDDLRSFVGHRSLFRPLGLTKKTSKQPPSSSSSSSSSASSVPRTSFTVGLGSTGSSAGVTGSGPALPPVAAVRRNMMMASAPAASAATTAAPAAPAPTAMSAAPVSAAPVPVKRKASVLLIDDLPRPQRGQWSFGGGGEDGGFGSGGFGGGGGDSSADLRAIFQSLLDAPDNKDDGDGGDDQPGVVVIVSDGEEPGDQPSRPALVKLLGSYVVDHPRTTVTSVPPVPDTRMRKVLSWALGRERDDLRRRLALLPRGGVSGSSTAGGNAEASLRQRIAAATALLSTSTSSSSFSSSSSAGGGAGVALEALVATCRGDLRHALQSLDFHLRAMAASGNGNSSSSSASSLSSIGLSVAAMASDAGLAKKRKREEPPLSSSSSAAAAPSSTSAAAMRGQRQLAAAAARGQKGSLLSGDTAASASLSSGRDDFFDSLHTLGKLLHAKRSLPDPAPQTDSAANNSSSASNASAVASATGRPIVFKRDLEQGNLLSSLLAAGTSAAANGGNEWLEYQSKRYQWERLPLALGNDSDIDRLMMCCPYDASTTATFIAENAPAFFSHICDISACWDALSISDVVGQGARRQSPSAAFSSASAASMMIKGAASARGSGRGGGAVNATPGMLELLAESMEASIVSRAVSSSNIHPVNPGFKPLNKPQSYGVEKVAQANYQRWIVSGLLGVGLGFTDCSGEGDAEDCLERLNEEIQAASTLVAVASTSAASSSVALPPASASAASTVPGGNLAGSKAAASAVAPTTTASEFQRRRILGFRAPMHSNYGPLSLVDPKVRATLMVPFMGVMLKHLTKLQQGLLWREYPLFEGCSVAVVTGAGLALRRMSPRALALIRAASWSYGSSLVTTYAALPAQNALVATIGTDKKSCVGRPAPAGKAKLGLVSGPAVYALSGPSPSTTGIQLATGALGADGDDDDDDDGGVMYAPPGAPVGSALRHTQGLLIGQWELSALLADGIDAFSSSFSGAAGSSTVTGSALDGIAANGLRLVATAQQPGLGIHSRDAGRLGGHGAAAVLDDKCDDDVEDW